MKINENRITKQKDTLMWKFNYIFLYKLSSIDPILYAKYRCLNCLHFLKFNIFQEKLKEHKIKQI